MPGGVNGPQEATKALRLRRRRLLRTQELGIAIPDSTLLLKALEYLTTASAKPHPQVLYRISTFRHQHQLDCSPGLEGVLAFSEFLLAEMELLSLSIQETQAEKKARLAKVETGASEGQVAGLDNRPKGGKGKGKGEKGKESQASIPSSSSGQPGPASIKPACKGYLTPKGCRFGDYCTFLHDFAAAGRASLCYACGATDNPHCRPDCPYAKSATESQETSPASKAKGAPKGKGKGKDKKGGNQPSVASVSQVSSSGNPSVSVVTEAGSEVSPSVKAVATPSLSPSDQQLQNEAIRVLKGLQLNRLQTDAPSELGVPSTVDDSPACILDRLFQCLEWDFASGASWTQDGGSPLSFSPSSLSPSRASRPSCGTSCDFPGQECTQKNDPGSRSLSGTHKLPGPFFHGHDQNVEVEASITTPPDGYAAPCAPCANFLKETSEVDVWDERLWECYWKRFGEAEGELRENGGCAPGQSPLEQNGDHYAASPEPGVSRFGFWESGVQELGFTAGFSPGVQVAALGLFGEEAVKFGEVSLRLLKEQGPGLVDGGATDALRSEGAA